MTLRAQLLRVLGASAALMASPGSASSTPVILECLRDGSSEPHYWRISEGPPSSFATYDRDVKGWQDLKCENPEKIAFGPTECSTKISETEYKYSALASLLKPYGLARYHLNISIDRMTGQYVRNRYELQNYIGVPKSEETINSTGTCKKVAAVPERKAIL